MADIIEVSPAHEQIARRAYEIYLECGGISGNDLVNWFLAEQELKAGWHQPSAEPRGAETDVKTGAPNSKQNRVSKNVKATLSN